MAIISQTSLSRCFFTQKSCTTCKTIWKPAILSAAGGKHISLRNYIGVRLTAIEVVDNKLYQSRDFLDAPAGTKLISVPRNTTVLRKSLLSLTCQTDGSPEGEFRLYFNGRLIKASGSGIFHVSVMSDGSYTCVPVNKVGAGKNASVIAAAVGKFTSIPLCIKKIV